MLFGIFQILIGCFCGLMVPVMIGARLMPPMAGAPHGHIEARLTDH